MRYEDPERRSITIAIKKFDIYYNMIGIGSSPVEARKLFMADRDEDAAIVDGHAPGGIGCSSST